MDEDAQLKKRLEDEIIKQRDININELEQLKNDKEEMKHIIDTTQV